MLTRAEWLLAARQAEGYPVGFGLAWGYGPLLGARLSDFQWFDPESLQAYG